MEIPPPDPLKLLEAWMEWERGEAMPGRVMSNLKTAGMRDLLDAIVAALPVSPVDSEEPEAEVSSEDWAPFV